MEGQEVGAVTCMDLRILQLVSLTVLCFSHIVKRELSIQQMDSRDVDYAAGVV